MQLQEKPNSIKAHAHDAMCRGLYLHVPFCSTSCEFCGFYTEGLNKEAMRRFEDTAVAAFTALDAELGFGTVFWGGGTPGLLTPGAIEKIGSAQQEGRQAPFEWTIELAPATINKARLRALKSIGVTRLSIGVQSFSGKLLDAMGREHSEKQAVRAYELARNEGFDDINLDLMFALPGQSIEDWEVDLAYACDLQPDHLSTYCLTFEEDTVLWMKMLRDGSMKRSEEEELAYYLKAWSFLEEKGYAQYEVSNFAKPGHECVHNLNTWRMHEWLGIGPSAASQWNGKRWRTPSSLEQWCDEVAAGKSSFEDEVTLTPEILFEDSLVFGLRMREGVDLGELVERFGKPAGIENLLSCFSDLINEGLMETAGGRHVLTCKGRLLADAIALRIMEVF